MMTPPLGIRLAASSAAYITLTFARRVSRALASSALEPMSATIGSDVPTGVRVSESSPNGSRMIDRARKSGWEGVIAKRIAATYIPGARSRDWLKLKLQHRAEFVVGGFTEPRRTRQFLGAILLGYFDSD